MKKVAIQGVAGSFHEAAATKMVPENHQINACDTFREVFESVTAGEVDYGVVAVENSLQGSINAVYRLLEEHNVWIGAETFLQIEQCLIGCRPTDITSLNAATTVVMSHPVALVQAETWLNTNLPLATRREYSDTAKSVEYVVKQNKLSYVAIASNAAAELYGGSVLAKPVNDDPHNYTRFYLLSKDKTPATNATRTSIILTTDHAPGSLYRALGVFANKKINLSKLDSHPVASSTRSYAFYIDFDLGIDEPHSQDAFKMLTKQGCRVNVLGSYSAGLNPV